MKCKLIIIGIYILSTLLFSRCYGVNNDNSIGHVNPECVDDEAMKGFIVAKEDSFFNQFEEYNTLIYSINKRFLKHDHVIYIKDIDVVYFLNADKRDILFIYDRRKNKKSVLDHFDLNKKERVHYTNQLQAFLFLHQNCREERINSLKWMLEKEMELNN